MITVRVLIPHESIFGKTLRLNLTKVKVTEIISHVSKDLDFNLKNYLCDESGRLREGRVILVNGINIDFLDGLETEVTSGDRVVITVIASGG